MISLYDLILNSLGGPEDNASFIQLSELAGDSLEIVASNNRATEYLFTKNGFQFVFDKNLNQFSSVFFHIDTAMERDGEVLQYKGKLPKNIDLAHNSSQVEELIGAKPYRSKIFPGIEGDDVWNYYHIDSLEAIFIFKRDGDTLRSFSLRIPGGL